MIEALSWRMRAARRIEWLVLVVALGGLAGGFGTGTGCAPSAPPQATPPAVPPPRDNAYVGSAACRECHSEIADRYAGHPMARSFTRLTPDTMIETYDRGTTFARGTQRQYRVERDGEHVRHHEMGLGPTGEVRYDQAETIEFAIGSGRRGRSYCLNRAGWLLLSPISWYAAERRWDLSPEYDPQQHLRFERPATDRCLQCHAGRLHYADEPTTEAAQRYAPPYVDEQEIGCERCHGPGARHVARHAGNSATPDSASRQADPTIVNPARLDPLRADDVCNQCHLTGVAQVLRYGRRHRDFRPGDHLGDIWVTLTGDVGVRRDGETKAVSHVEQMHASRCYQASDGRLGCVSCHDPHEVPSDESRADYYAVRCQRCHADPACTLPEPQRRQPPALGSCIACHMPRLRAVDVPHTTQTDHRVVRHGSQADSPSATTPADSASPPHNSLARVAREWRIFEDQIVTLPAWEIERARGLVEAQLAERQGDQELARQAAARLRGTRAVLPEDGELLDALAVCALLDQRPAEAAELWAEAARVEPRRQSALQSLMIYWMDRGETTRAVEYARRLVAVAPWQAATQARYSVLLERLGELEGAIEAGERAAALDPSLPNQQERLDGLYRRAGRPRPATTPAPAAAADR
ncbi:MAG: multiheme c-type cytochrome [Pirellulales bacterium]